MSLNVKQFLSTLCLQFQLTITNVLGNNVKHQNISTEKTAIDINELQNGIYFVTVKNTQGGITKKIVVQH